MMLFGFGFFESAAGRVAFDRRSTDQRVDWLRMKLSNIAVQSECSLCTRSWGERADVHTVKCMPVINNVCVRQQSGFRGCYFFTGAVVGSFNVGQLKSIGGIDSDGEWGWKEEGNFSTMITIIIQRQPAALYASFRNSSKSVLWQSAGKARSGKTRERRMKGEVQFLANK